MTGEPDRFFERIAVAASAVYRGSPSRRRPTRRPGPDFTLAARVLKRPDVTSRANRHAIAPPAAAAAAPSPAPAAKARVSSDEQMRRAIASGRAMQGLGVTLARTVRRADDPAQVSIDVVITVAGTAEAPVSTIFGLVDRAGAIRTSDKKLEERAG